jgi:hypothetical protein
VRDLSLAGRPKSRRSTAERLTQAHRSATLARLICAGMLPDRRCRCVSCVEARTAQEGRTVVADDWDAAYRDIAATIR